jgi:hypothetical protein
MTGELTARDPSIALGFNHAQSLRIIDQASPGSIHAAVVEVVAFPHTGIRVFCCGTTSEDCAEKQQNQRHPSESWDLPFRRRCQLALA